MLFTEFDNMLASYRAGGAQASESHGTLIGLYCTHSQGAIDDWLRTLAEDTDLAGSSADGELRTAATKLTATLDSDDLSFELLLPDDDTPLSARVAALASWCQGYLYGLAQGGLKQFEGLPGDCEEILKDLVELTKATVEDDSESSEHDFFELSEYVRVGVQLIYEELVELGGSAPSSH
ncbi:MAG: UPF0149 family protein [Pseudomonadota bacterium]